MQSIQAQRLKLTTRRQLFQTCGIGLGKAVLAAMLAQEFGAKPLQAMESQTRGHHHQPRVKRVIYLFMAGAPSQLDLFDNKPKLTRTGRQAVTAFGNRRPTVRVYTTQCSRPCSSLQV